MAANVLGSVVVHSSVRPAPRAHPDHAKVMGSPSGSLASARNSTEQGWLTRGWQLPPPVTEGGRLLCAIVVVVEEVEVVETAVPTVETEVEVVPATGSVGRDGLSGRQALRRRTPSSALSAPRMAGRLDSQLPVPLNSHESLFVRPNSPDTSTDLLGEDDRVSAHQDLDLTRQHRSAALQEPHLDVVLALELERPLARERSLNP